MRYLIAIAIIAICGICYAGYYDPMKDVDRMLEQARQREYQNDMREYEARQAEAEERRERQQYQYEQERRLGDAY
jgi:hypothetical protein